MTHHSQHNTQPTSNSHERGSLHVVPASVLLAVFAALLVLGVWNLWLAMGIATVKAGLVALYFMHLRYDPSFYALVLAVALLFVLLFVCLTLLDAVEYYPDIHAMTQG
jgi:cytochrome c oxidase subunit 4